MVVHCTTEKDVTRDYLKDTLINLERKLLINIICYSLQLISSFSFHVHKQFCEEILYCNNNFVKFQ